MFSNTLPTITSARRAGTTPTLTLVNNATERARVLTFIRNGFSEHFGVTAHIDPPCLLVLKEASGEIAGAVGLRSCNDGWFSTRYLDEPVDTLMQRSLGHTIETGRVVEVVHLAVCGPVMVNPLLDQLALMLHHMGYHYILCTVTRCLRRHFQRRGWSVTALAEAKPAALGENAPAWGRYYEEQPMVIVGDLDTASRIAASRQPEAAAI